MILAKSILSNITNFCKCIFLQLVVTLLNNQPLSRADESLFDALDNTKVMVIVFSNNNGPNDSVRGKQMVNNNNKICANFIIKSKKILTPDFLVEKCSENKNYDARL